MHNDSIDLKGFKIGFAITGSFCTHEKILKQIENLTNRGAIVYPIISDSVDKYSTRFGDNDNFKVKISEITNQKIISTIVDAEPIGPTGLLDIMVVAPCTGNTLARLANGITDSAVTMASKAHLRNQKPLIIAISTNDGLGANAKNIGHMLNVKNFFFVPFGQDDPIKKCNSLVANMDLIVPTICEALRGKQIQPILLGQ